ncbi:hypothetical protein ACUYFE_08170 [Olegusella massiliensis]|uniref:hypothetical protein n=1 Tax=Olegusella massiliensis TaxID=1776381 RepID=UPI004055497E
MNNSSYAERKEVAENLRKNADAHKGMPLLLNVAFAAFGDDTRDLMEETVTSQMAAHRLADLIDPVCEMATVPDNDEFMVRVVSGFVCRKCGFEAIVERNLDGSADMPNYCPYCGARVVSCND